MTSEQARVELREWLVKAAKKTKRKPTDLQPDQITDETLIVQQKVISSMKFMELLMFIESLTGEAIDATSVDPSMLASINTICANFFPGANRER
jgi:acyl carrier protein